MRKHFQFLIKKKFCQIIKEDIPILNNYLQESLFLLSNKNLKDTQIGIIESISKNEHSVILCDEFSGRKYSCMLGIMNRVMISKNMNNIENNLNVEKGENFFVNTLDHFNRKKDNFIKNEDKKNLKPKGALIICQKFEFATHYYRICRKLDYKNKLKMVRVGTSLHTVAPTVELDDKSITDSDEIEAKEKQEMLIGNINLINTTDWKNIDILFITPQMLEYVLSQKECHDDFDINPEIIMIDDFDYIVNSTKYDIKKTLMRFFSPESKFNHNLKRKLVLTSSSIQMENLISTKLNFTEKLYKSIEFYKNYLLHINKELPNFMDVITSPHFMNLDYHLKGIKIILKLNEGDHKLVQEKKLKYLQHLIDSNIGHLVICCSDSNIVTLKEHLKKKRLSYFSVNESDRVGLRLYSIMLYNKNESNILLITPIFLKSLNIVKINQIVLYDFISDQKDLMRILAKFPKTDADTNIINANSSKILHILYDTQEMEKNIHTIEYLSSKNK